MILCFSLIKLITAVNLGMSKNIYVRVKKRDCKLTLFYNDKQTKTIKNFDLLIYIQNVVVF